MIPRLLAAAAIAAALATTPALAQGGKGMGYNKATERTVTGVVEKVLTHQAKNGGTGLHLSFKTETGVLDVHVGPTNWLSSKKYEFATGDTLTVTGSATKVNGADVLIAREIVKGGQTFTLRNTDGFPLWSGRGKQTH
jgi:hypothetical protein